MARLLALLLLAQAVAAAQAPGPAPTSAPAGNADKGKATYLKIGCQTCHGTMGQGGAGARLAPRPLPAQAFVNFVRKGAPNHNFLAGMPAYAPNIISDADLNDIRAYLASIPTPPPIKDIPLLNQ